MITIAALLSALGLADSRVATFAQPLDDAAQAWGITHLREQAVWLTQLATESEGFSVLDRQLRLAPPQLVRLYPLAFQRLSVAGAYAGKPEATANRIYAGQHGNGDEASSDGWRFRPRGLVPVVGRARYAETGEALGLDLLADPDQLATPSVAAHAAAWRWSHLDVGPFVEAGDFNGATVAYVGRLRGMSRRLAYWKRERAYLARLAGDHLAGPPMLRSDPNAPPAMQTQAPPEPDYASSF